MAASWCRERLSPLFVFRAPAPVQPEPLLGMLADPAFDHAGDDLHRAGNVDFAVGTARRLDLLGQLATETVTGQTDDAGAVYRAIEVAGEPRQQRIGHGAAT